MQLKVAQIFKTLQDDSWQEVDASVSIDALHKKICDIALETIEKASTMDIGTMP